jgi:hypothetical protein
MELDRRRRELADMKIASDVDGHVVECLDRRNQGRFVLMGEPLATVASGCWEVRAVLTESEVADSSPVVGDWVQVRPAAAPGRVLDGIITRVVPAGSRTIEDEALTQIGGGPIAVDPATGQAGQPYFRITVSVPDCHSESLHHGMTCHLLFEAEPVSAGRVIGRSLIRFAHKLMEG